MVKQFKWRLQQVLPLTQIIDDELLCYAYSTDASLYRMVPQLVVLVCNEAEIITLIKLAAQISVKLTFRAAGTSLSGQAITDQVLVVLDNGSWQKYSINSDGLLVTLEPGIIGAQANRWLSGYKRQIGPDPGSINAAKIGGIFANNSSGMCCGTVKNTYATLVNLRAVFADGTLLDTSDTNSIAVFRLQKATFITAIGQLRKEIVNNIELSAFIRKKFAIKNTSGYSLNAFLDYADPIKIIERLLVGSEGTLGFMSQVTLHTVAKDEYKALNLLYADIHDIINLTVQIAKFDVAAIELLDAIALKSIAHIKELQPYLIGTSDNVAAVMIELSGASQELLNQKLAAVEAVIKHYKIIYETSFIQDTKITEVLWQARKGLFPTVAGQRPLGSSVIVEDVAVEIELLPELIHDLQNMFKRYGYVNAAIFGHVLAGNVHFVLTPNFKIPAEVITYDQFMHEFTHLVANKYNGSLKAEHGSGRNIAPFALMEWGQQCFDIMWRIKELFDPQNILNPDVKLTRDNTLHMHNLKEMPAIDPQIDKCMECGFCEAVCPSRKLSLTPRQRNAVMRKISGMQGDKRKEWEKRYQYYGIDTCATTGMCQTVCPVGINTGEYMLSLKTQQSKPVSHARSIATARNKLKFANGVAGVIGRDNLHTLTQHVHNHFKSIPIYLTNMPKVQLAQIKSTVTFTNNKVLLLPSCPSRIFAATNFNDKYNSQLVLEKMGFSVDYPSNWDSLCCGQMYHSQCNHAQQQDSVTALHNSLHAGPVAIIDNSSCAGFAKNSGVDVIDINQFILHNLEPDKLVKKYAKLALHIDCSSAKQNYGKDYLLLLKRCADEIVIPEGIVCCGFAGDKGFTTPELNASSLSDLATQVKSAERGVTFNRSCQIGLSYHSGIEYISFVELILECLST